MLAELVCTASDERWLDLRRTGIGASDMPIVLGLRPGLLALWGDKTGKAPREKLEGEWLDWGHRLEPVIIEAFGDRTGWPTRRSGQLLRHPNLPWALATLDGEVQVEGEWYPLEVKTTGVNRAGDWEDGPPENYRVQVHQQMLVTGAPRAYIACLIGGQRLVWAEVERDETLVRKIIAAGDEFWRYVEAGVPPPHAADGTFETKRALELLYPKDNGSTIELAREFEGVADELAKIDEAAKLLEARKFELQNKVREAMGAATVGLLLDGRSFTWKTQQRRPYVVPAGEIRVLRMQTPKESKDNGRTYH